MSASVYSMSSVPILLQWQKYEIHSYKELLFVLKFYGQVNPMGSGRAWSVYLLLEDLVL